MSPTTTSSSNSEVKSLLDKQPILLFDGECGFCNKTLQYFLAHEREPKKLHFAPLQSEPGKVLRNYFDIDPGVDSLILIRDHSAYIKSCAALRLTPYMKGLWPLAIVFVVIPPFIRNWVYDIIARRRQKIAGRVESCALLKDEDSKRFLAM